MKKILFLSVFCAAAMLLLPLLIIENDLNALPTAALKNDFEIDINPDNHSTSFTVQNCEDNTISKISAEDYIFGVVAAEMPALYEEEALKAQAVAAYTFALSRKAENSEKAYDITNDHTTDQSFITEAKAREKWGSNADTYIEKIKNAINDVKDYVILYDGKIITSVYHAISGGKTEDSNNVWGVSLPYLKPVSSEGDKLAENYITVVELSSQELKEKLSGIAKIDDTKQNIFKNITRTNSGTVKKITAGSTELTGANIRAALELRSSNFKVDFKEGNYKFTVYGYGHGVGLSQNGANYMAKQGFNFKEILTHYYSGCKIEKRQ